MKIHDKSNCPYCHEGTLKQVRGDYVADLGDEKLRIPNVEFQVCENCGEDFLPIDASKLIDAAVAEHGERLSPAELRSVREGLGIAQNEMSEILGLGAKTFHRWENGSQYPSRSMGYYIRVLQAFPDAFNWLKARGWRKAPVMRPSKLAIMTEMQRRFPVLAENPERLTSISKFTANPARTLFGKK
jgi:putative zinc finger/helix-turn-helix YgiT family protein